MSQGRFATFLIHLAIILAIFIMVFPLYVALVAATHSQETLISGHIPIMPGTHLWQNIKDILIDGVALSGGQSIAPYLLNSLVMALIIAIGKVGLSITSAFAVVYFDFPGRKFFFCLIFATMILPVEVRLLSTFHVMAEVDLINTYAGLTLPLIASATATFLFRQFFMTIPQDLVDAARIDGAGPIRFFMDVLLPLSKSNIIALFIIMFVYGWNQYLWPLVITTDSEMNTVVMALQQLSSVVDQIPQWNYVMTIALMAMLPPVFIVLILQKRFEKGLLEVER